MSPWREALEDRAQQVQGSADAATVSIAISLKRIADWLDGNGPSYLTDRIAASISEGMHHGFGSNNRSRR